MRARASAKRRGTKRHWILVLLFTALCTAAIATDCAASDVATWVSRLPSRLEGDVGGELGGVTFNVHVALGAPLSVGVTWARRRPHAKHGAHRARPVEAPSNLPAPSSIGATPALTKPTSVRRTS